MADPFMYQALSVLFTVSPESFDSVTEDKALALSWGKTDEEQEKRSF